MKKSEILKLALMGGACVAAVVQPARADEFNIPGGDLRSALHAYVQQTGVQLIVSDAAVRGARTHGVHGNLTVEAALTRILSGTGFIAQREDSAVAVVPGEEKPAPETRLAQAAPVHAAASVETVVVTSSKIKGDIQTVPIAITALSQEQLTSRQIAGGPDLVKEVPNLTFTKTNFSGYSIQIRGIGTQAISVTTDPAVAVALNDIPFIRNHFFEQEFFDVNQVEVLRGPQGTLYGRNATAGVVNVISAKPTDQFEAMLSADWGNYTNRRYEGMVNIPIVDDRVDLRIAGEWTKRDGYSTNEITGSPIDGRDLWSTRVTLAVKPTAHLQVWLVWEHFQENDDRLRTSKQLCKTAPNPVTIDGVPLNGHYFGVTAYDPQYYVSQGCEPTGLYSADAFEVPNGLSLSYASAIGILNPAIRQNFNPYASTTQSTNLRVIESAINPTYRAKNDTVELNADYAVTPELTLTSQTGYNNDFLFSSEDYNRFNTAPGIFEYIPDSAGNAPFQLNTLAPDPSGLQVCDSDGHDCRAAAVFCDPQVGCSDRLVAQDLSDERAWQFSQEFRFSSNFSGPFNFSVGGNYLHYQTEENYYVFFNTITQTVTRAQAPGAPLSMQRQWIPGVSDNSQCMPGGFVLVNPFAPHDPTEPDACAYIDPNPITSLNNEGHNYFLSQNPYTLNSYAGFGETYYSVAQDLKLTGGLRWTDDQKHFIDIPSELLVYGYGYPVTGTVDQEWNQWTGRLAADWTPKLAFTDQTLVYGSYAHGYKAGGANPPGATLLTFLPGDIGNPIHPLTFKPEFVDAYELGTKNTMLDGGLTLNGDVFFYDYKGYQISRIVDRTAINDNFNAKIKGAELEAAWEPLAGLKFNFAGGYESTRIDDGQSSIDLMDRTAGNPDWMVLKPFITQASNCIVPKYVVAAVLNTPDSSVTVNNFPTICEDAYVRHLDPVTQLPYVENPAVTAQNEVGYVPPGYQGFDWRSAPNNGEGFAKPLGGNELPNAPHFTTSLSADYTLPVSEDWAATLHSDFYWQSQSWARVFNDRPYDKLRGYSNVNLALILTSADGWQVMGYLKNVFDTTAITGDFLNSDDSGLTTNVFLTDPRLFGVRVTKNW
jgi:iron complex outermembrane recepter protein